MTGKSNWKAGCVLLGLCWLGGIFTAWAAYEIFQHLSWR